MRRRVEPEIIDDPATSQEEVEYVLRCVRITNRKLGGIDTMLDCLKAWAVHWPRDRAVSLLDIGTGAADLPLAAVQWARSAGFDLRVTGLDANERVLIVARNLCKAKPAIRLVHADAMALLSESTSPFPAASFDYVHAGMFLHHLDDASVPRMLIAMHRLARAGIIWNDLIRSNRGYAVAWVATIGRAIRHDCLASLRAGFTRAEVQSIASQAGLTSTRYRERFNDQRFALIGDKPGAWEAPRTTLKPVGAAAE